MRISDWSSDVCSSDLPFGAGAPEEEVGEGHGGQTLIAALGLLIGIVAGLILQPDVPIWLEPYLPIAVVAALDAVFGGLRAFLDGIFDDKVFVVSFFSNVVIARSEERRVGKEWVSTFKSRWSP